MARNNGNSVFEVASALFFSGNHVSVNSEQAKVIHEKIWAPTEDANVELLATDKTDRMKRNMSSNLIPV